MILFQWSGFTNQKTLEGKGRTLPENGITSVKQALVVSEGVKVAQYADGHSCIFTKHGF